MQNKKDTNNSSYPNIVVRIEKNDSTESSLEDPITLHSIPSNINALIDPVVIHPTSSEINTLEDPIILHPISSNTDTLEDAVALHPTFSLDKEKILNFNHKASHSINPSDSFFVSEEGSLYLKTQKQPLFLANFNVTANKIVILDNGQAQTISYNLTCYLSDSLESKTLSLTAHEIVSSKWIISKLGIKYYLGSMSNAYNYFQMYLGYLFHNTPSETHYSHVGWRKINNQYVYLHGGGIIGNLTCNIQSCHEKFIESDNKLSPQSALSLSFDMLTISNSITKTLPLFLYAHLAVLKQLFEDAGHKPKFILWVYGLTGSMKTSVSKVFFNLFNSSREYIPATFKDTPTALELKIFEHKDSVLLLDDYHPTILASEKHLMQNTASYILRLYGDGISKSRSNPKMGKVKEFPPRGLCVVTGEDIIGGESTIARCISVEVCPTDFNTGILSYYQNHPLIFSTHMSHFIYWVSQNTSEILTYISETFPHYRNSSLTYFRHKRLSEAYAHLKVIQDIFEKYCISLDFNIDTQIWDKVLLDIIHSHENISRIEDPGILYLIALQDLISTGKCYISPIDNTSHKNSNKIGYENDECYYLFSNVTFNYVVEFWRKQGISFPVSSDRLNKALDTLNVIKTEKESKSNRVNRTVKASINGEPRTRYLTIYKKQMQNILNNL